MRGILLAGGNGTRLNPITLGVSKQLLPVYDKPAIYYPLSTLMLAGIREILVISTPRDIPSIERILGDGKNLGLDIQYLAQEKPEGIAQAFLLGEKFIGDKNVCLILGDNLFFGHELPINLDKATRNHTGARIFAYRVSEPSQFGVVEIDSHGKPIRLEEKPKTFISNWAVTGLYFYDPGVVEIARRLKPSPRGELEITDVNREYLTRGKLEVECLGRGIAWLDLGTADGLLSSSLFVQTLEPRQGLKIGCLEEIALLKGYIDHAQFSRLAEASAHSAYGQYLLQIAKEGLIPGL